MAKKKALTDKESLDLRLKQLIESMGLEDKTQACTADQYVAIKDVISTGVPELDRIMTPLYYAETGKGGVPKGFVVEFFGPQGGGKSSACMKIVGNVTKAGGIGLWVDAEACYNPQWGEAQGIDSKRLTILHNNGEPGEFFLEKVITVAEGGLADIIVLDSITALQPKAIQEAPLEKDTMGKMGAMMSKALPKIVIAAKKGNVPIVFVNQIRDSFAMFGNPESVPGGKALKFYCSLRIRINPLSKKNSGIWKEGEMIGIRANAQIVKNRFGPPWQETPVPFYFSNTRPHPLDAILDEALSRKIITSKKTKKLEDDGGDPVYCFTYGKLRVEGFDEFKAKLKDENIQEIAVILKAQKWAMDQEVHDYLKSLDMGEADAEPGTEPAVGKDVPPSPPPPPGEGDPGA